MRGFGTALTALALAACGSVSLPEDVSKAQVDEDWPTIPEDAAFGQVSAVATDDHGHIFVLHRAGRAWEEPFPDAPIAEPTVFMFARNGRLLDTWGADTFIMPHGISVDEENKVWITDVGREQVFRFSHEGEEELAIGERGVTGSDPTHFGRPADVEFIGDRVLVADGYVNTRVAEFDRAGNFLREWGDFDIAHDLAVDEERVYVADRENGRIRLFTHDGEPIEDWDTPTGGHPYGLAAMGSGWLLAVEGRDAEDRTGAIVRVYRPDGKLDRSFDVGLDGANASLGHDIAIGSNGIVYVTDVYGGRVVRFELAQGAGEESE